MKATVAAWADWSVFPLLRGRVVGRQGPAVRLVVHVVAGFTRVEHLAHPCSQVAVLLEELRQGGEVAGVLPPVGVEVIEPGRVWSSRGQEGGSARSTDGLLSKCASENCSSTCQEVQVWGKGCAVTVTSEAWFQIIHNYQQDIWAGRF